jgi:DNA-binding SARP family transcriptional activator
VFGAKEATTKRWFELSYPAAAALVILHPNFGSQHLLLPIVLDHVERTPILLTLASDVSDLNTIWSVLAATLNEQFDQALPNLSDRTTPDKAAQTALKALKPLGDFLLFIDSYDLADSETVQPWIEALVKGLPEGSQIVLGGRQLPLSLLESRTVQGKVALFPVEAGHMLLDYVNRPAADRVLLEVYGFGPGRALVNGKLVDQWDGVLPRSLFFYFVDRGMTTRDEIFHTFWPTLPVREATNVFHVTKRKISEILGFDLTVYWSGFYRVAPTIDLQYDVIKFAEDVQNSAVAVDDDAIPLLEKAVYVYRGTFLSTLSAHWADSRREELRLTYVEALSSLAKLRERRGEPEEALGLYLRAAAIQPHREDLARGIMSLYQKLGQPQRAVDVYRRLEAELKRNFSVTPDRRTNELLEQIRASK